MTLTVENLGIPLYASVINFPKANRSTINIKRYLFSMISHIFYIHFRETPISASRYWFLIFHILRFPGFIYYYFLFPSQQLGKAGGRLLNISSGIGDAAGSFFTEQTL